MDNYIELKDQYKSNDLSAYALEEGVEIEVFEFDCELSKEDTIKLRDFLTSIIDQ